MKPKEKAQELVNKFLPLVDCGVRIEKSELENAKKCALISINEIVYLLITMDRYTIFPDKIKYYEKVTREIIAL
jgi:hypothetical protein